MGTGLGTQVGLRDDDPIQRVLELLVEQVHLVATCLDMPLHCPRCEILCREVVVIDLVAVLATRTASGIVAGVGERQRRVTSQLGNKM
jgi:hypothetical protein